MLHTVQGVVKVNCPVGQRRGWSHCSIKIQITGKMKDKIGYNIRIIYKNEIRLAKRLFKVDL